MDTARFQIKTDGYGWDRIWDSELKRFLPGRHYDHAEAEHRVMLLNQGAAVPAVQSREFSPKTKSKTNRDDLRLF